MSLDPKVAVTKRVIVEYDLPGMIVTESTSVVLAARDVKAAVALAPQNAFSFTIHEEYEGAFEVDGKLITMVSGPINKSGRHFIDAVVLDEDGLRREGMTDYQPGTVVKSRLGNKMFFTPGKDQVVHS